MIRNDVLRLLAIIDSRIKKFTRSMARVETTWGEVAATDVGARTVDVYIYGNEVASEDFRVIGGSVPAVGTVVKVAMDKERGDRWVMEPIVAAGSGSGTGTSLAHSDLTGVTANQHHNQQHSITSSDHTTSETDTTKRLAPDGIGGVAWAAAAASGHTIKEAGTPLTTRAGLNFGAGFDLADDAGNNETDVAIDLTELTDFTDHSARHENGGADEISLAGLDGTPTELTNHLNDTTDAHDASAVSILDTGGYYTGTDVEAALAEIGAGGIGGGGGGGAGGGIATLQLNYNYAGSDISGASAPADTWTDVISNQSFDVDSAASVVEFLVRGVIQCQESSGGDDFLNVRLMIDSAGTSQTFMLGGQIDSSQGIWMNPMAGIDPVYVSGLSAGSHTVKLQIRMSGGGTYYLRPSAALGMEFLSIQVVEHGAAGGVQPLIGAKVYNSANQVIATGTETAVTWDTEEFDTDGFHSTVSNTSRLTVPAGLGGKYLITANIGWEASGSGSYRYLYVKKNGTIYAGASGNGGDAFTHNSCAFVIDLVAGDYLECYAVQNSGSNRSLVANSTIERSFSMTKLDSGKVGQPVGAKVYHSTSQTPGANTAFTFDSEEFDTDGFHSTSSNPTRLTIPAGLGGKYLIQGYAGTLTSSIPNFPGVLFRKNGSTTIRGSVDYGYGEGGGVSISPHVIADLLAGDYVEFMVAANSITAGGSSANDATTFSIMRLDSVAGGGSGSSVAVETVSGTSIDTAVDKLIFDDGVAQSLGSHDVRIRGIPAGFIGAKAIYGSGSPSGGGSYKAVPFSGTDEFDTDGFHDPSSNNSRMTIPAGLGGKYLIHAQYYGTTNELKYVTIKKNGSDISPGQYATSGDDAILQFTIFLDLVAGDYIELGVNESTPGILTATLTIVKLDAGRVGGGVGARVYNNAGQSIADSTSTVATFNSEDFDTDGFHSVSSNTGRLTIPAGLGGKYLIGAGGRLASPGTGGEAWFRKNGSTNLSGGATSPYSVADINLSTVADLVAGDYVELLVYRTGGGSADFGHATADERRATFWLMKIDSNSQGVLASGKVSRTAGNLTPTGSFATATGMSITLTTGARRCRISVIATAEHDTSASEVELDIALDGVRMGQSKGLSNEQFASNNRRSPMHFTIDTDVLTAGTHTFELQFRHEGSGTGTLYASTTNPLIMSVVELPDSGALATSGSGLDRVIRGQVAPNGTIAYGSGFSAAKTATGKYTITFDTPFSVPPVVVCTPMYNNNESGSGDTALVFMIDDITTTTVEFFFLTNAGSTFQDRRFTFIAMAVQ